MPPLTPQLGTAFNFAEHPGLEAGSTIDLPASVLRITGRPIPAETTICPASGRTRIANPTLALDLAAFAPTVGVKLSNLDLDIGLLSESPGTATCAAQFSGPLENLTLSGLRIKGGSGGLSLVGDHHGSPDWFTLTDSHLWDQGAIGLYLTNLTRAHIERCSFDNQGWDDPLGRTPDRLHALYANEDVRELILRACLFTRSRLGSARAAGENCTDCTFLDCGSGPIAHSGTRTIRGAIVQGSHHPGAGVAGGYGVNASNGLDLDIRLNYVAHAGPETGGSNLWGIAVHRDRRQDGSMGSYGRVRVCGNRVYDWSWGGSGCCVGFGAGMEDICHLTDNTLQQPNGGLLVDVEVAEDLDKIVFARNRYFSTTAAPFRVGGRLMTWEQFRELTGDTTSTWERVPYADPLWTVDRYCREVLKVAPGPHPASTFAAACRADWRVHADFRLRVTQGFKPPDPTLAPPPANTGTTTAAAPVTVTKVAKLGGPIP